MLADFIGESYRRGLTPQFWKIEGTLAADGARTIDRAIAAQPQCRQIILGKAADIATIERWFAAAHESATAVGFAIGRSVFWEPSTAFLAGSSTAAEAAAHICANYLQLVMPGDDRCHTDRRRPLADRPTLEETIALLEATVEATHDGIVVVDLNRRVILHNKQYLKMFGLTADDVERGGVDGLIETLSPQLEDLEAVLLRSRAIWSDPSTEVVDVLRFKDGRIYQRYTAPHRVNSRIVGRFASFRDIGESVRAAEAIEQHRAFLEKAQEVAHIGSWVAELDGTNALGWSAETHRIFGVPLGQFDRDVRSVLRLRARRRSRGRAPRL